MRLPTKVLLAGFPKRCPGGTYVKHLLHMQWINWKNCSQMKTFEVKRSYKQPNWSSNTEGTLNLESWSESLPWEEKPCYNTKFQIWDVSTPLRSPQQLQRFETEEKALAPAERRSKRSILSLSCWNLFLNY